MRTAERGLTLLELSLGMLLFGMVVTLTVAWIFQQMRVQQETLAKDDRQQARARALLVARDWIRRSERVLPSFGAVRTERNTLVLELPMHDEAGYRATGSSVVTLQWTQGDRFLVGVVGASSSARVYSPAASTGEIAFAYLDDRGLDVSRTPERARAVQVQLGDEPVTTCAIGGGRR